MTNPKLKINTVISNVGAEINVDNFEKNIHHRVSPTSKYEADILFTFTSLTRWFLNSVTETINKTKKSATFK